MIRLPTAAWTGISNCWRGMSSLSFFVGKARAVVLQIRRRNLLPGRFWGAEVLQKCRPLTFIQPSQRQNIRGTIAKFGEKPGDVFRGVISANHQ